MTWIPLRRVVQRDEIARTKRVTQERSARQSKVDCRKRCIVLALAHMDLSERPERAGARHPWEKARFRFFHDVLEHARLPANAPRVLDAGAGDAWFSSELLASLGASATITCWDAEYSDG